MLGPTHALAGATVAGLFLVFNLPHQYPLLVLSVVGGVAALVPDLDGSESTIENIKILGIKPLKIPAYFIDKLFKHRGFLHSLMALVFLAFILLGLLPNLPSEITWVVLLGYFSHLLTDALTPAGIPWLYPLEWRPTLLTKLFAIRTGSIIELLFFVLLVVVYLIFLEQAGYVILPR